MTNRPVYKCEPDASPKRQAAFAAMNQSHEISDLERATLEELRGIERAYGKSPTPTSKKRLDEQRQRVDDLRVAAHEAVQLSIQAMRSAGMLWP